MAEKNIFSDLKRFILAEFLGCSHKRLDCPSLTDKAVTGILIPVPTVVKRLVEGASIRAKKISESIFRGRSISFQSCSFVAIQIGYDPMASVPDRSLMIVIWTVLARWHRSIGAL
ncbi:hypothetical protein DJ84_23595 [Halorubrum ezzemoulense]|nr:hypothetical protein DJ84_23595 [Halorubrum ezzemoulense]